METQCPAMRYGLRASSGAIETASRFLSPMIILMQQRFHGAVVDLSTGAVLFDSSTDRPGPDHFPPTSPAARARECNLIFARAAI